MAIKKVVFTALFGKSNYDLFDPLLTSKDWDYICFSDQDLPCKIWKIHSLPAPHQDPIKAARNIKILNDHYLPDYDLSMWVDSRILIKCDMNYFTELYLKKYDMVVMKHPSRSCIYDEAQAVINLNKGEEAAVNKQIQKYKNNKFPPLSGLVATTYLLRKHHNPWQQKFMQKWWKEIEQETARDQLSFNYVLWNHPLNIGYTKWHNHLQTSHVFCADKGAAYSERGH